MVRARLGQILDQLESFYGVQSPDWPTDPFLFLVWWHCGYPPGADRCTRGWEALSRDVGTSPEELLAASTSRLTRALQAGGMVPQLRAARLREIAARVRDEYAGDLRAMLADSPLARARALLKKFPGIGDPGADRILLFAGIAPVAAVPSGCPYVLLRIGSGREPAQYTATYREAQRALQGQVPETVPARSRAYLLLQWHGRQLCKRTRPRCSECPVARSCAYFRTGDAAREK
jgi:endonuclease-3